MSKRFLTTQEAAEILGLSPMTLTTWRSRQVPRGPAFVRMGRAVRYEREEIERFIEAARVNPAEAFAEDR